MDDYLSLEELQKEKNQIQRVLNNLNNVSQKALGLANGARANLINQKNEWNQKLSNVNKKIIELQNTDEKSNIEETANIENTNHIRKDTNGGLALLAIGALLIIS